MHVVSGKLRNFGAQSDLGLMKLAAGGAWNEVFRHRYWPVAFELFFSDQLLNAMFGAAATQHAPPGSYSAYFRGAIEAGLCRPDAAQNYFLTRRTTIYGGSSEIQRNIIAKMVLGL